LANKCNFKNILNFSLLSSVALIWNLDTGVPITGAFLGYLLSLILFPKNNLKRTKILLFFFISIMIIVSSILLFFYYLEQKAGGSINLTDVIKYQNIFYVTGFGMLPIERGISPWQIICATYVLGLCISFYSWQKNQRSPRWDLFFYISVLGLGLFSYYEGRSHTWTLISVSWPAIIILFILIDYIVRLIQLKRLPKTFLIPCIPILLFGVFTTSAVIQSIPILYKFGIKQWSIMLQKPTTTVIENLNFIKNLIQKDKEAIILSSLQSVYYSEAGLASPIKGPSSIETYLQQDRDKMIRQIIEHPHKHLFIQLNEKREIPDEYSFALKHYRIVDKNDSFAYLSTTMP
jgi:hypothetical protein